MFSEVLPNCAAPLIVQASLGVSTAILDAAAAGLPRPGRATAVSEWGTMLADAREFVLRAWWVVTFPAWPSCRGAGLQLDGRRLRDALDPKLKRNHAHHSRNRRPARRVPTQGSVMHAVEGVSLTLEGREGAGHRRRDPAPARA
jgi:hypothetical protein